MGVPLGMPESFEVKSREMDGKGIGKKLTRRSVFTADTRVEARLL